ncbi:MAG: hypothetical protein AUI12_13715 [Acidobacteria bacterium 13_2_20CM_2_57_6]|nr:MAG: hypothetical protein AUH16_05160 [Acidobacteria bacterium 13_2_20CM_57_7]OLB84447.1 MAG: hypothetical protein AUI12_13715 [Acidobacteria bacterium 13_2_20CM_2_57_6]PYT41393.1 MAG: hypothetical protein DMG45_13595 [Acidobacteriota bacterium]PYT61613.1 MAG: hypothetical protein DMG46_03680 [Acidobacteriota bacterium]
MNSVKRCELSCVEATRTQAPFQQFWQAFNPVNHCILDSRILLWDVCLKQFFWRNYQVHPMAGAYGSQWISRDAQEAHFIVPK